MFVISPALQKVPLQATARFTHMEWLALVMHYMTTTTTTTNGTILANSEL